MKRYKEIDIFRAIGVTLVALYHFWVVSGYKTTGVSKFDIFLSYGGEIGVTLFFIISGFSIYISLKKREQDNQKIIYKEYISSRLKRIYPQYIVCLFIALLLSDSAVYLASVHISSIISHVFLIHNLSLTTHGSISGVLWTMGVIFQFYLFAVLLYRYVNKDSKIAVMVSVGITIVSKYTLYNYLSDAGLDGSYYFIYGRQLVTALDNFVIGMFLAKFVPEIRKTRNPIWIILSSIGLLVWIICITPKYVLYSNSTMGYVWHTVTAILLAFNIYAFFKLQWSESIVSRGALFIGENEYGIYLWHLLIANNLIAKSGFVQTLLNYGYWPFAIVLFALSILAGWLSCNLTIRRKRNG